MGNRAVLAFGNKGIYVHWNGGRASVEAFLSAAKDLRLTKPESIAAMIKTWAGDTTVSLGPLSRLDCDNWDNGLYDIGPDLTIIGRAFVHGPMLARGEEVNPEKTAFIRAECIAKYRVARNAVCRPLRAA